MPRTRKSHPPSLKAKVAVEAIKAHKTAAQIAQMFGVHPTQAGGWKKQALAGLPDIFGNSREQIKWIRIIFRCWKEGKLYDEQVHLQSLQKRRSPLGVPNTVVGWKPVAGFQKFSANPS